MSSSQLRPLIGLRWRMVRSRKARIGFAVLVCAVPVLCLTAVVTGLLAPRERSFDITLLAPTAYLSVALLAVLAPLVSGGGNDLFPPEQLSAFPVTARTQYAASVALTPLNLAWTTQLVALLGLTAYAAGPTLLVPVALLTCLAYIAFVTLAGQALAWGVVGVRQRAGGRRASWAAALLIVGAALLVLVTGNVGSTLDRAPTTFVVNGALAATNHGLARWFVTTALLVLLAVLADMVGRRLCAWALGRPGDAASRIDSRPVARRAPARSARSELLAVDRASVWRSQPLRRGLFVLGVLPGAVAATAGLDWSSLVLLPGLVSAGAGLLFGVNAFCLDGSGALWLASLPGRSAAAFWSKTRVVAETCLAATAITLAAGTLRAGRTPTTAEVAAMTCCGVVTLLRVVATCMVLSITRPHRADLRGPRDTPAPPGVMAAYSARLAVSTTLVAVFFSTLAATSWQWPVVCAVPFVLLSVRRLLGSAQSWGDVEVRARVVATVAAG